jgi:hypothetical protein
MSWVRFGPSTALPRSGTTPNQGAKLEDPQDLHCEYRAARPPPGEPLATSPDDVQLRRDVPEGGQLRRLEFQGDQRLDCGWIGVE